MLILWYVTLVFLIKSIIFKTPSWLSKLFNKFLQLPILFLQVSSMFGGLALCSLEAVVAKDGTEYIIEVNDCAMGLLGDKMMIAEMVLREMEVGTMECLTFFEAMLCFRPSVKCPTNMKSLKKVLKWLMMTGRWLTVGLGGTSAGLIHTVRTCNYSFFPSTDFITSNFPM